MTSTPLTDTATRPRRRVDLVIVGAATATMAALILLTLIGQRSTGSTLSGWVDVAVAVVSCALVPVLLLRRSLPAAILLAAMAAVSACGTPGGTMAVFQTARTRRPVVAAAVAGIGIAAHLLRWVWQPLPGLGFGWWTLLVISAHVALAAIGALSRARAQVIESLRERARRAEADAARQVEQARAAERARIAREMHDVLAHRLSLLATYAGALEFRPEAPPDRIAAAATVLRDGTHQALEELRGVIGLLRHDDPDGGDAADGDGRRPLPDLADLPGLIEENRRVGASIELTVGLAGDPPEQVQRTAYRVVQEGLTNARRHAAGASVAVTVDGSAGDGLLVEVANGPVPAGGPTSSDDAGAALGAGAGLVGLAERVALAGGELTHGPANGGFLLRARLPWPR